MNHSTRSPFTNVIAAPAVVLLLEKKKTNKTICTLKLMMVFAVTKHVKYILLPSDINLTRIL